ncbi:MAG: hypothetical protein R3D71_09525 [Rickettsiales bacterium]
MKSMLFLATISTFLTIFPYHNSYAARKECVAGGCSGQLCLEASGEMLVGTCEWKEEYTCYNTAACEKQSDGKCGWTKTDELAKCLKEKAQPTKNTNTGENNGN